MNFSFENQGTHTYLVYTVAEGDIIDTMSLGMITNNKIHGLAHTLFTQMDATKYIKYDVSAKISVKQFFTGQVNKKRLLGVFHGIVDAMLSAEDYMIDVNSILLNLDYIFADVSTCETVMVCLPIVSDDLSKMDLASFFKNIMFTTQFDQTENCDHVAKIINFLNSSPVFSLDEFKKLLDNIDGVVTAEPAQPAAQPAVQTPAQQAPVQQPVQAQVPPVQQPVQSPVQQVPVQQPPVQQPPVQQKPMQTPAQPPRFQTPPAQNQPAQPAAPEKKFSMFGLFKQKAPKDPAPAQPGVPPVPQQRMQPPVNQGFAVPGQKPPANPGFAAPGQKPPVNPGFAAPGQKPPVNQGFAVPGQKPPANQGFAVPGQKPPANQGFAVPGQNPPANQGFAVPGQKPPANQGFAVPGQNPPANQGFAVPGQNPPANQGFAVPGQKPPVQQPAKQPVQPQAPAQQPVQPQPSFVAPQMPPQGKPMNFGETTVLGASSIGETTVLGASPVAQVKPHLVRSKNNEKIDLNKPVFRIGKEKSYVDYFIGDNSAISRSHANVISRDGEYFVVDTNSTNHTYVNGQMIQSNVETKIVHGTKIKLANEDFEFKLY